MGKKRAVRIAACKSAATISTSISCRQVPFQQVLVFGLLDDRLHQGVAAVLDQGGLRRVGLAYDRRAVEVVDHGAAERVDRPADPAAGVQRKSQRLRIAEISPATNHRFIEVGASVLEPAHRDRAGYAERVAFPPEQAGRLVDLLVGRNDEQNRVRAPESGPHLPDEILVTRGVEQVDHQTPAHHRCGSERLRRSRFAARLSAARRRRDEPLEQGGLAGARRADENNVADLLR